MLPDTLDKAVKEWGVAVEAIRSGKLVYLLRKDGLVEEPDQIHPEPVPGGPFLLFPTYKNQDRNMLRAESIRAYRGALDVTAEDRPVRLTTICEIVEELVLENPGHVHRLWDTHVWNADYIANRINHRPASKFHIIFVRAYVLGDPIEIPRADSYEEHRAWIKLEHEVSTSTATPILEDPMFIRAQRLVKRLIES